MFDECSLQGCSRGSDGDLRFRASERRARARMKSFRSLQLTVECECFVCFLVSYLRSAETI